MHEPAFILMFISLQNCFETIIKTSNKTKLYNDKYERPEKPSWLQDIVNGLACNYTEFHLRQKIEDEMRSQSQGIYW